MVLKWKSKLFIIYNHILNTFKIKEEIPIVEVNTRFSGLNVYKGRNMTYSLTLVFGQTRSYSSKSADFEGNPENPSILHYYNADLDKLKILGDNAKKSGIYM